MAYFVTVVSYERKNAYGIGQRGENVTNSLTAVIYTME
jgi:hypothetical protein